MQKIRIGTAGWTIPKAEKARFPAEGSHLHRYAQVFQSVEINSSFYRTHQFSTYVKWANEVPRDFKFSIKVPRWITHEKRLENTGADLKKFCAEIAGLQAKLGCVLVQLPPSMAFDIKVAKPFFTTMRKLVSIDIACEPRHVSWFTREAEAALAQFKIARVAADPSPFPDGKHPGAETSFCYYRLHGSPRMYFSNYSQATIQRYAKEMQSFKHAERIWCFYDNTASGSAIPNALSLLASVHKRRP